MSRTEQMSGRERMLAALENRRADRLPCQVHHWMTYYLDTCLGGMDQWEAYEHFGLDLAIYVSPEYTCRDADLEQWKVEEHSHRVDDDGVRFWVETITTPAGTLNRERGQNAFTCWQVTHRCKTWEDFEIWDTYAPRPVAADLGPVREAARRLGDRGIIRSHPHYFMQGSPWQCFAELFGTQDAIFRAIDEPAVVHQALERILERSMAVHRLWEGTPADMVETDGGAGSTTVIGPHLFEEFCVPYDARQNALFRELGLKTVCHLCGGVMANLELVVQSGADGMETMTPPAMGGDCDLAAASRRVGDKLFFIGGFDQNKGFEKGNPGVVREMVEELFEATRDHAGYICSPSDHFFFGDPANIHAFVDACRACRY